MSGQTDISQINSKLSSDEEQIVDSILSEINQDSAPDNMSAHQQAAADQQMAAQQQAAQMAAQQQQQQQQQQQAAHMAAQQQQQAAQMAAQQQMMGGQKNMMNKPSMDIPIKEELSGTDKILKESKDPISVVMLVLLVSLPQIDELLKTNVTMFKDEESLSMAGVLFKALIAGVLFYVIKMYT